MIPQQSKPAALDGDMHAETVFEPFLVEERLPQFVVTTMHLSVLGVASNGVLCVCVLPSLRFRILVRFHLRVPIPS